MLEDAGERARRRLRLGYLAAAYLFAASYGMHEAADYLHARFCDDGAGTLCEIVAYQDDELSHFLFFAGFAGIAAVLLAGQAAGADVRPGRRELAPVLANAALVAAAIVANLGFEELGLDLLVIVLVAALAVVLWRRCGPRPLIVYFAAAYVSGLVVTLAVRAL